MTPKATRPTPLTDAMFKAAFYRDEDGESHTDVSAVAKFTRSLERRLAELAEYAIHMGNCEKYVGLDAVRPCTCGLDALLSSMKGE